MGSILWEVLILFYFSKGLFLTTVKRIRFDFRFLYYLPLEEHLFFYSGLPFYFDVLLYSFSFVFIHPLSFIFYYHVSSVGDPELHFSFACFCVFYPFCHLFRFHKILVRNRYFIVFMIRLISYV